MFAQIMTLSDVAMWPTTALLIFFIFMLAVFAWVLRPNAKSTYQKIAEGILKDVEAKRL